MAKAKRRSVSAARYEESFATKDKAGGSTPAFDWKSTDKKFFKVEKDKKYKISIIPYEVKTKNHPLVRRGRLEIGDLDYVMDIWLHTYIGPGKADIVCPKKNFGKPCPICEQSQEYYEQNREADYKELKASRKVYYNIINQADKDAGIQLFETSHFLFEKELIEAAQTEGADSGTIVNFGDIEDGKDIQFRTSEEALGKNKFIAYKSIVFVDRKSALEEDLIDEATSFDEIMKVMSYDEISAVLHANEDEDSDDDDEDERPAKPKGKRPAKKPVDDDDESDDEDSDDDDSEDDDADDSDEDSDDEDDSDDEEEEEEPVTPKATPSGKKAEKKPAPAEKAKVTKTPPAAKEKAAGKSLECPSGYKFGTDCDKHDECEDCLLWSKCLEAQKAK